MCAALRAAVLIVCAVCLIAVPGCSRRRSYPAPDDAFYVYDGAGVLSEENERYIAAAGADLYEKTGAQIVVVTVDTTGTEDIADYAEGLFNEWGIGSSDKNNGVLLLISVGEDDYWTVQGSGLEDLLSSGMLKLMLNEHMEPKFAAGDYDGAARSMFDALLAFFETAYQVSVETAAQTAEPQQGGASPDGEGPHGGDGGRTSILGPAFRTVAITVAVIALILFLVIGAGGAAAAILFLRSAKNSPDPGPEAAQKENRNPYSQTYRGPREGYRPEPTASAPGKNPYT
jgi:uncharacterized protein